MFHPSIGDGLIQMCVCVCVLNVRSAVSRSRLFLVFCRNQEGGFGKSGGFLAEKSTQVK